MTPVLDDLFDLRGKTLTQTLKVTVVCNPRAKDNAVQCTSCDEETCITPPFGVDFDFDSIENDAEVPMLDRPCASNGLLDLPRAIRNDETWKVMGQPVTAD